MANPLQKGIDTIDALMDEPTQKNIKTAIDTLSALTKETPSFRFITPLKAEMIQYNEDKLAGFNMEGRLNVILDRFRKIYEDFKQSALHNDDRNQDEDYGLLCKLNFNHQTDYFESLMKGRKKFISFVIRGPQADYGQRWLANKLIQEYRNIQPLHEPIGLDFLQLNLKLESFVEHLAIALGINFQPNMEMNAKRIKLKNQLGSRIVTRSQFIILINSYTFIHSAEYQEFLSLIKYFSEEINNNDELPYKCVFLFVEEQNSARYKHINDCIFSEELTNVIHARRVQDFRFIDLGLTSPISLLNVNDWLGEHCSDEQLCCFQPYQDEECEMLNLIGDGNPQKVIPIICATIGINYIEKEKIWLRY